MGRSVGLTIVLGASLLIGTGADADPPVFVGEVSGIELAPQSIAGAAIFLFVVDGEIDGRTRRGFGWVAVNHDLLPEGVEESSAITGGGGAIWVGLRRYEVAVTGGELILVDKGDPVLFDDAFGVDMSVSISRRGESGAHQFLGLLDHEPFPPTIEGSLGPPIEDELPEDLPEDIPEELPIEEQSLAPLQTTQAEPLPAE